MKKIMIISTIFTILLLSSCGKPAVQVKIGDMFEDFGNQFRILKVQRYSFPYLAAGYKAYDDYLVVLMNWGCTRNECVAGGSDFVLTDNQTGRTIFGASVLTDLSSFSLPNDAHLCCGLKHSNSIETVYLIFKISCSSDVRLAYPYGSEVESKTEYEIPIPAENACH